MSRAGRPARSHRVTWKDRRVSWPTVPTFAAGALATAADDCTGVVTWGAQADPAVTDWMLRWWAGGRGWPATAFSMSARSAPAWSCPITGPAGTTTLERTSGA